MATNPATGRLTQDLPRLVDQLRILLWFQMYASLFGLLAVTLDIGVFSGSLGPPSTDETAKWLTIAMLALFGLAVLTAIGAGLTKRGWFWVYGLIVIAELGVAGLVVLAFGNGLAITAWGIVYAALLVWIVVDLCRAEVRRHFFARSVRGVA